MSARAQIRANCHKKRSFTFFAGIVLLWASAASADGPPASRVDRWQISVPLYLTGGVYYQSIGDADVTIESVTATVEFLLSSEAHPYSAAFFVDYMNSPDSRYSGSMNAGAAFELWSHRWDLTAAAMIGKSPGAPHQWGYAGRLRYRFAQLHRVGIEVVGSFDDIPSPGLMLGYYGDITGTFSLRVAAGARLSAYRERVVRAELVWRVN